MKIEQNNIYFGDCLELMISIYDKSIDMILADLPYGSTNCKWDSVIPFEPLWKQYKRIIKNNGAIILTASQPFTSALIMSNPTMFRYEWIWNKDKAGNIMSSGYQPMKVHENILVFSKHKTIFNKQMTDAKIENIRPSGKLYENRDGIFGDGNNWQHSKKRDNTKRNPKSIINISSVTAECNNLNRVHPTQKPVELFKYLIKTYTNENDLILDNVCGSGTTAIASMELNRRWICMEKDEKYFRIAKERIDKTQILLGEHI